MTVAGRAGLGRAAAYGVLAVGLEKAVALGIALYLPRHLALADYGRYAFLLSYLGLFQGLSDAGLEAVLVTRLAGLGDAAAAAAGRGAAVRLGVSLAGAGTALVVLALTTTDRGLVAAGSVAAVGLAAAAANPYRALLRARLALGRYLTLLAAQAAVALAALLAVTRLGGGLPAVLAAVAAGALAGIPLGRLLAGPGAGLRTGDRGSARGLLSAAWPLAASAFVMAGGQQVLQLLLLRNHGAAAVGLYGGAQKLIEAVGLLPQAVMVSVLPALALAGRTSGAEAARAAREAGRVLVVVLLPVAVGLVVWAEPLLVRLLGPAFGAGAPVLRVLAAVALLGATGSVLTNLCVATGLQRTLFAVTSGTALAMAALGGALVPAAGAIGAAWVLVATMTGGQLVLLVLPATRALARPVLAGLVAPLGLGAVATVAVVALGGAPLPGAALLLVGYPLALLATGTVTRADLARWRSA